MWWQTLVPHHQMARQEENRDHRKSRGGHGSLWGPFQLLMYTRLQNTHSRGAQTWPRSLVPTAPRFEGLWPDQL